MFLMTEMLPEARDQKSAEKPNLNLKRGKSIQQENIGLKRLVTIKNAK